MPIVGNGAPGFPDPQIQEGSSCSVLSREQGLEALGRRVPCPVPCPILNPEAVATPPLASSPSLLPIRQRRCGKKGSSEVLALVLLP